MSLIFALMGTLALFWFAKVWFAMKALVRGEPLNVTSPLCMRGREHMTV